MESKPRRMQGVECFDETVGLCRHSAEHEEVLEINNGHEVYYKETCGYHACKPVEEPWIGDAKPGKGLHQGDSGVSVSPAGRLEVDGRALLRNPKVQADIAALSGKPVEARQGPAEGRGVRPIYTNDYSTFNPVLCGACGNSVGDSRKYCHECGVYIDRSPEPTKVLHEAPAKGPAEGLRPAGCDWCRSADTHAREWPYSQRAWEVECRGCGASGPRKPTEAEAVAAWNSRAPARPPITRAELERQTRIDISNLHFYASLFRLNQWETDVIHWNVFEATLLDIAKRIDAAVLRDLGYVMESDQAGEVK